MTKAEFISFIENIPDDMELMVETEAGLLPICRAASEIVEDDVYGEIAVIAPCFCDLIDDDDEDEEMTQAPQEQADEIINMLNNTPDPRLN
jgi:hypothetical protein